MTNRKKQKMLRKALRLAIWPRLQYGNSSSRFVHADCTWNYWIWTTRSRFQTISNVFMIFLKERFLREFLNLNSHGVVGRRRQRRPDRRHVGRQHARQRGRWRERQRGGTRPSERRLRPEPWWAVPLYTTVQSTRGLPQVATTLPGGERGSC